MSSWFQEHGGSLDGTSRIVSDLAAWPAVAGGGLVLLVATVWLKRWQEAWLVGLTLAGEPALQAILANRVHRARPFAITQPCGRAIVAVGTEAQFTSFPSGHSAAAVALYGVAAVLLVRLLGGRLAPRTAAIAVVVIAALVAASRVYRRLHFLTDVIGGAALGGAWLAIAIAGVGLYTARVRPRAVEGPAS